MANDLNWIKWGKAQLRIRWECAHLWNLLSQDVKDALWFSFSQGQGEAAASAGTHRDGWCGDFSFRRYAHWTNALLHKACQELTSHGFACAPRREGELGPGNPAHLHVAYHNRANYVAVITAQKNGLSLNQRIDRAIPPKE